jgi:hypothetical protein
MKGLSNMPAKGQASPTGDGGHEVLDTAAHPPEDINTNLVMRFTVPESGSYSVDLFGGTRKPVRCGDYVDLSLWKVNGCGARTVAGSRLALSRFGL